MVDRLLEVLCLEFIGVKQHADKIRKVYEEKKGQQRCSGKCIKGMSSQRLIQIDPNAFSDIKSV